MKFMLKNQKKGGFTLIEILVVIGIIAILAAIVLIAINPARQFAQARDTERTSNVNAILNAVGQYMADEAGEMPAGVPAVGASDVTVDIDSTDMTGFCGDIVSDYMPALPTDPRLNTPAIDEPCPSVWDTGYDLTRHPNGRITVFAQAEIDQNDDGVVDASDILKVTR